MRLERDREIVINSESSGLSAVRSVDVGKLLNHVKSLVSSFSSYCFHIIYVFRFVCAIFFLQQLVSEP